MKLYENFIKRAYKKLRRKEQFILDSTIVKAKKGKVKYQVFLIETAEGDWKINLNGVDLYCEEFTPMKHKIKKWRLVLTHINN